MINKKTIAKFALGFAGSLVVMAGFAGAASAAQVSVSAELGRISARSDAAIALRITSLTNLSSRIGSMKNVSAGEKSGVSSEVQTEINNLTSLKAKIDADTDAAVARDDEKTITGGYRIFMLVIPQGYILASADRISTIVGLMTTLQAKFQARIAAAQTAGKDVASIQSAFADMSAKMSDATAKGQSAESKVAPLVPDQGNATVAASNKAALISARADIKAATADLKAARKDMETITDGLKAMHLSATATAAAH